MHNQNRLFKVLKLISLLKAEPPKSVQLLAKQFETTPRTIYRYLDLLKEAGFLVEKNSTNKVFIENLDNKIDNIFTSQEAEYIRNSILQKAENHALKDSILLKLNLYSAIQEIELDLSQAHIGQTIKTIQNSIENKTQVVLKSYLSANSNTVSDRRIEPIKFSADYNYLFGFEPESQKSKLFSIDRIKDAKTTVVPFQFSELHQLEGQDIFNFLNSGKTYSIDLVLNLRAFVLLKKEFPMVEKHIQANMQTKQFYLKADIYNLKPIARFVKGLPNDVEVLGSDEFITYLKNY